MNVWLQIVDFTFASSELNSAAVFSAAENQMCWKRWLVSIRGSSIKRREWFKSRENVVCTGERSKQWFTFLSAPSIQFTFKSPAIPEFSTHHMETSLLSLSSLLTFNFHVLLTCRRNDSYSWRHTFLRLVNTIFPFSSWLDEHRKFLFTLVSLYLVL